MSHSHHPEAHFESRMELRRRVAVRLLVGALILAVLLAAGYLGFVQTNGGQAFDNTAYAGRPKFTGELATFDADILGEVSKPALLIALSCVVVVSLLLRCPLVGIVAAAAAGAAVFGAEFFKHMLPRPMLSPATVPVPGYFVGDTYPSGHTTIGSSVAFALTMIAGPRMRPWIAVLAGAMSASFATAVFFMGWHRPSDALGGIAWSGFCMGAAAIALVLLQGHHARPGRQFAFGLNAAIAAAFIVLLGGAVFYRSGALDLAFFGISAAIIAFGFAVPAWLAFALSPIAWRSSLRQANG